jgi:hypothetical protein
MGVTNIFGWFWVVALISVESDFRSISADISQYMRYLGIDLFLEEIFLVRISGREPNVEIT